MTFLLKMHFDCVNSELIIYSFSPIFYFYYVVRFVFHLSLSIFKAYDVDISQIEQFVLVLVFDVR